MRKRKREAQELRRVRRVRRSRVFLLLGELPHATGVADLVRGDSLGRAPARHRVRPLLFRHPEDHDPDDLVLGSTHTRRASRRVRADSYGVGIRDFLQTDANPPMRRDICGREMDVFVSGHTHAPSLSHLARETGDGAVIINFGCWLRQLRPVPAHLGGPPVFVPRFLQTHARVYLGDSEVRAELWEHPKPALQRLRTAERLAVLGRLSSQPARDTKPEVSVRGRPSGEL